MICYLHLFPCRLVFKYFLVLSTFYLKFDESVHVNYRHVQPLEGSKNLLCIDSTNDGKCERECRKSETLLVKR